MITPEQCDALITKIRLGEKLIFINDLFKQGVIIGDFELNYLSYSLSIQRVFPISGNEIAKLNIIWDKDTITNCPIKWECTKEEIFLAGLEALKGQL